MQIIYNSEKKKTMNFNQIKQQISITSYLESIGSKPQFENEHTARYIAPHRTDINPSLSINKRTNLWYDHGLGKGGNIIQLVALINNCSNYEASKILMKQKASFSFHRKQTTSSKTGIDIKKKKKLENRALLQYLQSRMIDIEIAQLLCLEAYYSVLDKDYFAIAFANDQGGYELRSKYFKGCTSKSITTIPNGSDTLLIFEGFIDYLSFLTYSNRGQQPVFDCIVLNSVSNIEQAKSRFSHYQKVNLYLDNDCTGKVLTSELVKEFQHIVDCSSLYLKYKDFNDFLIATRI